MNHTLNLLNAEGDCRSFADMEREIIVHAMNHYQCNLTQVANALILQRKQFDLLVPGHPGLGMRPTCGLISANVIFHQQQGQLQ